MFLFWNVNIVMGLLLAVIAFLFVIIMDNITARIYWQWMLKVSWTILLVISVVNILFLYVTQAKIV
jgi:ech hydrogenase subunit B